MAKKSFIIQTRFPELPIFDNVLRGNISGFYKEEIESRKIFQYPPFKLLIKITKEGKNENQLNKEIEALQKILAEWKPASYSAFIPKIKNLYIKHILLKIDPASGDRTGKNYIVFYLPCPRLIKLTSVRKVCCKKK